MMRKLAFFRLGFFAAILVTCFSLRANAAAADVVVHTRIATEQIRIADPLFVEVQLHNPTERPLAIPAGLGSDYGSIQFEIRKVGAKAFQSIEVLGQGRACTDSRAIPLTIPPAGTYSAYELLFIDGSPEKFVFRSPGTYELRALLVRVDHNDPAKRISYIESEVVRFKIIDRPLEEYNLIRNAAILNNLLPAAGAVADVDLAELAKLRRKLGDSELKRTLEWVDALLATADHDPEIAGDASRALQIIREESDPVTNQVIGIAHAEKLLEAGRLQEAAAILQTLKNESHHRAGIESVLKAKLGSTRPARRRTEGPSGG